ncbi:hypothetical protein GURASL_26440 [Geotalea uraniireducens]|uniref:histidine kinase n=1 Tax=Geotalea uraniireducens TaxID=351604 RepID=A0ABN6VX87_9BACT|nr:PAS domain S-box protein [Geotalea uraniireducens]BDV43721.1 hypothetical protein GURASL_26440 [Geotalea uraniireducens]
MICGSLKLTMTVAVSLLVLALMSTMAWVAYRDSAAAYKTSIARDQMLLITSLAGQIDEKLSVAREQLTHIAQRVPLADLGQPKQLRRFLDEESEARMFFDDGMYVLSATGASLGGTSCLDGHRADEFVKHPVFRQALQNDQALISDPYEAGCAGHHPAIAFVVPIHDVRGRIVGLLVGRHNLLNDTFLGAIASLRIGTSGYVYAITAKRHLAVHKEKSRILDYVPPGRNAGIDQALAGFDGSLENLNSKSVRGISSFVHLKAVDWILACHYPLAEAYAPLVKARGRIFAFLVVALVLSTAIVWLLMKFLTAPLLGLTAHVRTVGGKRGAERFIARPGRDEIGDLAQAFNAMLAEIDRKSADLRQKQEKYRIVAQFTSELAVWHDEAGVIRFISSNCLQLTGYEDREFYARPGLFNELVHPDERDVWTNHLASPPSESWHDPLDLRIVTKSGTVRWLTHNCHRVMTPDGAPRGIRSSFQDITERKVMEEVVRAQRDFAESLIQNAAVPMFVIDAQHRVIIWNRACEELTGLPAPQVIGTSRQWQGFYDRERPTLADVVLSGDRDTAAAYFHSIAPSTMTREGLQAEGWYTHLGGKARYISFDAAPVRLADGTMIAVVETLQDITQRKIAEENVAKLRDFYLTLFEEFPAPIWRAGVNGLCNYFNRTWLDFTGRTLEQELGEGWLQNVHPDDRDHCLISYRQAFNAQEPFVIEYRLCHASGEYRWLVDNGRPFHDLTGQFAGYIGVCFDISERRKAEDELRKLMRAVEQSASSIVITDTEGTIEYVNQKFVQVTGYGLHEAIGQNPRILKSGDTQADKYRQLWETITSGGEWRGELHNKRKNGEFFWEFATIAPIYDSEGQITHYLAVKEDITARKEAERALLKSKAELVVKHEQLSSLFKQVEKAKNEWEETLNCMADLVLLIDRQGKIRRCNKAVLELTGKGNQEIVGTSWQELLLTPEMEEGAMSGRGREYYHRPSDRWFFLAHYTYGEGETGTGGGVITLHDTTEIKRVSAALEEAYGELKSAHAQMLQKEKMASIGQLAAGVAHEINNPIGFITSNLGTLGKYQDKLATFIKTLEEMLAASGDQAVIAEIAAGRKQLKIDYVLDDIGSLIAESLDGADRVRKIVQDLKSFSRVDEAECKMASVHECLDSTINIVWNEIKYKATLNKDYGDIPLIKCYPQQLNQVFMNLLVNAAHAIDKQGEIAVRTWTDEKSLFVSIADTGAGIPVENLSRIFEPFFTTKEVGKGTGLGLSISYDIVKKHGGDLSVASEVGVGTTFTVRLPMITSDSRPS